MPEEHDSVDSFGPTVVSADGVTLPINPAPEVTFETERYAFRSVLGAGGMGEVRLCGDAWIGRDVAMKVAHPGAGGSAAQTRGRFLREARVQGQLEHPNIVPVYDIGKVGAEPFFTMKRIGGHTLEEIVHGLKMGAVDIGARYNRRKLLSAMSQVCLTIAYAHSRGVIHRDLKPANVMLGDFGEVYVLDWGVAKLRATDDAPGPTPPVDAGDRAVTQAGTVIGTPGYMSPEQLAGATVTPSADVYALGAILYEVLALAPLHQGMTAALPPELEAMVVKATASMAAQRYASARALHEAIESFLDGERDAERRQKLASSHMQRARQALGRGTDEGRAEGMRELGRAVALDPTDESALRAIREIVLAPSSELPKGAKDELERGERQDRTRAARRASRMYIVWLGLVPLLWFMGIRSWAVVGVLVVLILASSALAQWGSASVERATLGWLWPSLLLNFTLVAACSCIFGPFVIVPGLAATSAAAYMLMVREKTWRRALPFALAALAIFVPLLLEYTGVLPRPYSFEDGNVVIHPFAVSFVALPTAVSMSITTFVQLALPAVMLNRALDSLVDAEHRSFAQAWRLRQLLP